MNNKELSCWLIGIAVCIFSFLAVSAKAGEIIEHPTDPTIVMFIDSVVEGDSVMLEEYLETHPLVTRLALYSGGGMVSEGIAMMQIIHGRGINTVILKGMKCYSICSFMWLGGKTRIVHDTGELGVHQVFAPHEVATEMGAEAYASNTMSTVAWMMWIVESEEIVVDQWWWIMMLNTKPDDMHIFERDELEVLEVHDINE